MGSSDSSDKKCKMCGLGFWVLGGFRVQGFRVEGFGVRV